MDLQRVTSRQISSRAIQKQRRLAESNSRQQGTGASALTPYVARVQAAGHGGVRGAFDDGAAVGEKCHFIRIMPELQDKVVVADGAMRLEAATHFGEINGALAFVNLHRVSAAQSDVRAAFAREMSEIFHSSRGR